MVLGTYRRSETPEPEVIQPCPARVLVQTLTHLVPSDGVCDPDDPYSEKSVSMVHRMAKHVWGREFDPRVNRMNSYGDEFGYNNRPCFFLVDYGTSSNDDDVPMLAYEWDGENFKPFPELLDSKDVQEVLKEYPFTPSRGERREKPPVRKRVRSRLRCLEKIPDDEIEYMLEHSEDMEWLQRKVRPRFWESFLKQVELRKSRVGDDEGREGQ